MRKFLLVSCFSLLTSFLFAQFTSKQTLGSSATLVQSKGALGADSAIVFPKDTIQLLPTDRAIAFKGTTVYLWDGVKWILPIASTVDSILAAINQLDSISTILRDEMKIQAANTGLTSTGGITLVDSTVTILDTIRWTIGAKDYVKITPSSFIINTEDSGLYRRDLIYADTTGILYKVVGIPDSTIGVSPHLPDYAVTVTIVDVFGDQVFNPSPIIIDKGKNPTLQQVTNRGNTTTDQIVSNYNGGGYGFTQNSGINGFSGIGAFNTNSGTGAASGFIAVNNVGHIGQLFQGSSNNAYAADAFLVRGSGAGGMKITTDIGRISFNRGLLYTVNTPYEMGAFETDGSFRLNNYKNNASKDSALSTDETGKLIMRFNSGVDNAAYHTISAASDSSYGTWNRPNGTKDTLVVVADGLVSGEYILPIASASTLGGVKIGSGLSINGSGVLSTTADSTVVHLAGTETLTGYKTVSNNFNVSSGYAYRINDVNVVTAQTTLINYYFGGGNLSATGNSNTNSGGTGLVSITTGSRNTNSGSQGLRLNTTGYDNTNSGMQGLYSNITGFGNTNSGMSGLYSNTVGYDNTNSGMEGLYLNTTGFGNTNSGWRGLYDLGKTQTAGTFHIGTSYTIVQVGTTNFTLIGAANNNIGTTFTATGVGVGTGTATPNGTDNNTSLGYNSSRGIYYGSGNTILGANVVVLDSGLTNNIILANGTGAIKAQHNGTTWSFTGGIILPTYGAGAFTGTPTKQLSVTSTGIIIETSQPIITTGTVAPTSTPVKIGDIYIDTAAKKFYFAGGASSSTDWIITN